MLSHCLFRGSLLAVIALFCLLSPLSKTHAADASLLVKSASSSAVYTVIDSARYVFTTEKVFKSWQTDFSKVQTISSENLAAYPLKGAMTYRPGVRLVKIQTDPKVYAVSRYGVLHWVTSEELAAKLYGPDWNKNVDDISDAFFTVYTIDTPLQAVSDYSPEQERLIVNPEQNIKAPLVGLPTPAISISASTAQTVPNQFVTLTSIVTHADQFMNTVQIFEASKPQLPLATCTRALTCKITFIVPTTTSTIFFFARATNDTGQTLETPSAQYAAIEVLAVHSDLRVDVDPAQIAVGTSVTFSSNSSAIASSTIQNHKILALIPGEPTPILWKNCNAEATCKATTSFYRTTQLISRISTADQIYYSPATTITMTTGTTPLPVLSVSERPQPNMAILHLEAPTGDSIGWSTIVDGDSGDDRMLGICNSASCEITIQFTGIHAYRAFTNVGGKLEQSNVIRLNSNVGE